MMDGLVRYTMCLAHGSAFMQLVCLNSIVCQISLPMNHNLLLIATLTWMQLI